MSRTFLKDTTVSRGTSLRPRLSPRFIATKGLATAIILSCCLAPVPLLCSCGHDEPTAEHDNPHRPGNNDTPGNGNGNGSQSGDPENGEGGENSGDQPEEVSPIVGVWSTADGTEVRSFSTDGSYHVDMPGGETLDGSYAYDDFKRWLYLSLTTPTEIKSVEYRCIIEGDRMTLYDLASRETVLTRR